MGKRIGNELSTITSSELSSVIYSTLAETIKNPFSREIFLCWVRVAGIRYRENIDELIKKMKVGDRVILVREPENEYDDLAIMIQSEDKEKIGYVPRVNNEIPARLMDAGMSLCGKISRIKEMEGGEYPWDALSIDMFWDEGGSGMNRPFSREVFLGNIPTVDGYRIKNIKRVLCRMKSGDQVLIRRESDNEQDELAVVVLNRRMRKLGYIPRSNSVILARLLDAGKHIYGVASKIDYDRDGEGYRNRVFVDIYMED